MHSIDDIDIYKSKYNIFYFNNIINNNNNI